MIHSIKTKFILGVSLLVILIVASIPFISKTVESLTTEAFNIQSKKEQINLLHSLSNTQKEGLIAWMRPWYSDETLAPLVSEELNIKKWEGSLLGIGNQISVKFGVDRILTFDEDLVILNNYKVDPKASKIDIEDNNFTKILKLSDEDDAISRGIINLKNGEPAIVLVFPIEHEESETSFYQAFVINLLPLLKIYKQSTTYSSYFKYNDQNIILKSDKDIASMMNIEPTGKYVSYKEDSFFKRTIALPEELLGKNIELVVFVKVTDLIKDFKNTESIIMKVLGGIFLISIPFLFGLVFFLLKPLNVILNVSEKVSEGDYGVRSSINSKSEIGILSDSFNGMLGQIELKDGNMRSLLNGLTVGVFDFDQAGSISSERSKQTNVLFDSMDQVHTLDNFFKNYECKSDTTLALKLLFDPTSLLDFSSLVSGLLPTRMKLVNKRNKEVHIKLEYSPIYVNDVLVKVIVIAEDISKQVRAETASAYQKERVGRIATASINVDGFMEEVEALSELYEENILCMDNVDGNDLALFKRLLHTLKGNLALSNFDSCAKIIHNCETLLVDFPFNDVSVQIKQKIQESQTQFEAYFKDLEEVLGLGKDKDYIKIAKRKIENLEKAISKGADKSEINKCIKSFEMYPVSLVLGKYQKYVETISENLMKEAELIFDVDCDEVTMAEISNLDMIFGHILRNCVDHGIEEPEVREALGKNTTGQISILITRSVSEALDIKISDDGGGINYGLLAGKALENGLWSTDVFEKSSEEDKINLIFDSGLTIKDEVSDTSGRGVGMDAVKSMLEESGGSIHVSSQLEKGSSFIIKTQKEEIKLLKAS